MSHVRRCNGFPLYAVSERCDRTTFINLFICHDVDACRLKNNRSQLKSIAKERIKLLINKSLETAVNDLPTAQKQIAIARRISLKYNIRLSYFDKQIFCHGCKNLIVPGINARIRLRSKPKAILIKCFDCGFIYRRFYSTK